MDQTIYLIGFIMTMALATFATRVTPFIFFGDKGDHPYLIYLGRFLPPAIMLLLLIYCFKDLNWFQEGEGLYELICLALVTVTHVLFRNAMISILAGTFLFMCLKQGLL